MPRRIEVRSSPIHGKGVFALSKLDRGRTVARYAGLVRSHSEADLDDLHGIESGHTFLFALNDHYVVDATGSRCAAKWLNHSCAPNCESVLIEHSGTDRSLDRIELRAIQCIEPGTELTFDYGIRLPVRHTRRLKALWACRCGMPSCTGTMLKTR